MTLNSPITDLAGIGPKRAECFRKLGIEKIEDLLYHFPRAYKDKGTISRIIDCLDGEVCTLLLTVSSWPSSVTLKHRMTLTKFRAFDESGCITVVFFNQRFVEKLFTVGSVFRFYGKLSVKSGKISLSNPEFDAYYDGVSLPDLVPVYSLSEGLSQKILRNAVSDVLSGLTTNTVNDIIPTHIKEKYKLEDRLTALFHIHKPRCLAEAKEAGRRFAFEEFFKFALSSLSASKGRAEHIAPIMRDVDLTEFYASLPFEPTNAQLRTISEIKADLTNEKGVSMSRLVSGDVGSGKTLCAVAAMYIAAKSGYQSALMAPTEILSHQHYADISKLLSPYGIKIACLTSSTRAKQRREISEGLENGTIDIVIGTHSLISDTVNFSSLGLVITDEQHRFGVAQRAALSSKSKGVHTLVMSATPIPRTLALILYGDLDVSAVDEMPKGRQRVDTFAVDDSYRDRLNGFIRKQANEGSQVYIVCPSIESPELDDESIDGEKLVDLSGNSDDGKAKLKSAVDYAKELREEIFPDLRIGLIHGKLKPEQKDEIMGEFADGSIDVLVSTTVIEVGVNVPNATLIIIENAERFGLSALHQLRGRVGRGKKKAYCILVSNSKTDSAKERIGTMCRCYNGYEIAQKDLEMRGPGDLLPSASGSARQSGDPAFKFASLYGDMDLFKVAYDCAKEYEKTNSTENISIPNVVG